MTKKRRALMEWYLMEFKGKWSQEEKEYCDLCRRSPTVRIEMWARLGDVPYFCEEHAREMNLLW